MREPDAGRRSAARRRSRGQAKGRGPKAEGSEPRVGGALGRTRSQGGSGRAASRDGENDSFAFGASLLGFVELGP